MDPYPCTVAARYFAHISVVSSRQRSNDVLWRRGRELKSIEVVCYILGVKYRNEKNDNCDCAFFSHSRVVTIHH